MKQTLFTIISWIFDGIIDVYIIDGVEGLDFRVCKYQLETSQTVVAYAGMFT